MLAIVVERWGGTRYRSCPPHDSSSWSAAVMSGAVVVKYHLPGSAVRGGTSNIDVLSMIAVDTSCYKSDISTGC